MAPHAADVWTDSVVVGGHEYQFAQAAVRRDGTQLWTVSFALADMISRLELQGSSVDLGCGCGLVGMVADATLVDRDPIAIGNARETLRLNRKTCPLIEASWNDISGPFDNVFGSEILYPIYQPASVADLVARCWTGKGLCLFAVSVATHVAEFEQCLSASGLSSSRESLNFRGFPYTLIRVTGGENA